MLLTIIINKTGNITFSIINTKGNISFNISGNKSNNT